MVIVWLRIRVLTSYMPEKPPGMARQDRFLRALLAKKCLRRVS